MNAVCSKVVNFIDVKYSPENEIETELPIEKQIYNSASSISKLFVGPHTNIIRALGVASLIGNEMLGEHKFENYFWIIGGTIFNLFYESLYDFVESVTDLYKSFQTLFVNLDSSESKELTKELLSTFKAVLSFICMFISAASVHSFLAFKAFYPSLNTIEKELRVVLLMVKSFFEISPTRNDLVKKGRIVESNTSVLKGCFRLHLSGEKIKDVAKKYFAPAA